jgi:uncharacterized protein
MNQKSSLREVPQSVSLALTANTPRLTYPPPEDTLWTMKNGQPLHQSHVGIVKRLKRAEGHLRSVVEMIEAGRPCVDLAQQLQAVERAIGQAKRALIHDHIDNCLDAVVKGKAAPARDTIHEFKAMSKYL